MNLAHRAHVNVGIISTLWFSTPVFSAILDFFIFGQRLKPNQVAGMVLIICCGISISLSKILKEDTEDEMVVEVSDGDGKVGRGNDGEEEDV